MSWAYVSVGVICRSFANRECSGIVGVRRMSLEKNGGCAVGKRLVTIATFDQPAQARLAKNALDEAGIQSMVSDENLVAMDWLLSNAVGGVKVQVWEEDAD